MLSGRLFHRSGVATAKALDRQDFILELTGFMRNKQDDLRFLGGKYSQLANLERRWVLVGVEP